MLAEAAFEESGQQEVHQSTSESPHPHYLPLTASRAAQQESLSLPATIRGQYNGYKMVHSSGRLFRADECQRVYKQFLNGEYPSNEELEKAEAS